MSLTLYPAPLTGRLSAIPSKSYAHRALLAAALGSEACEVGPLIGSEDILATLDCLLALGAVAEVLPAGPQHAPGLFFCRIQPIPRPTQPGAGPVVHSGTHSDAPSGTHSDAHSDAHSGIHSGPLPPVRLHCRESASTLRFFLPLVAALGRAALFTGAPSLARRSIGPMLDLFEAEGVRYAGTEPGQDPRVQALPLCVEGQLTSSLLEIDASSSSQYLTGLLFSLLRLPPSTVVRHRGPLASAPYVDLTLEVLRSQGVAVEVTRQAAGQAADSAYRLEAGTMAAAEAVAVGAAEAGPAPTSVRSLCVEGDWSNAAFWLVGAALGGDLRLEGLKRESTQGDRAIVPLLQAMGASLHWEGEVLHARQAPLRALSHDMDAIPDMVPILSLACASAQGTSCLRGVDRLRTKECDRLAATLDLLHALGIEAWYQDSSLFIRGGVLQAGPFTAYNDHRMVMTQAIAALHVAQTTGCSLQPGPEAKSYPGFFDVLRRLAPQAFVHPR